MIDNYKLSKTISHALRHNPELYDLILDKEGWVDVNMLILSLRKKAGWKGLNIVDVEAMINLSAKKRHEILNGKIRALYGHSTPKQILKQKNPPLVYYIMEHCKIKYIRY